MAIKKLTAFELECEGPCKDKISVARIPNSWSRLKITPTNQPQGQPTQYHVATLCPVCTAELLEILQSRGFKLAEIRQNGEKEHA